MLVIGGVVRFFVEKVTKERQVPLFVRAPGHLLELADWNFVLTENGRHIWQGFAEEVVLGEKVVAFELLPELAKEVLHRHRRLIAVLLGEDRYPVVGAVDDPKAALILRVNGQGVHEVG